MTTAASSRRTSLGRWLTSWRRSRSESRPARGGCAQGGCARSGVCPGRVCPGLRPRLLSLPLPCSLFTWVQPEVTRKLYIALWAAFLASCFFPYRLVGLAVGKGPPVRRQGASDTAQGPWAPASPRTPPPFRVPLGAGLWGGGSCQIPHRPSPPCSCSGDFLSQCPNSGEVRPARLET